MPTARLACQKFGGDLAVPMNSIENEALRKIAQQKRIGNPFIGLVRNKDKNFYTVKGLKPSYTHWARGEPNNAGGENCVHLYSIAGTWNDINCNNRFHFICQTSSPCKLAVRTNFVK